MILQLLNSKDNRIPLMAKEKRQIQPHDIYQSFGKMNSQPLRFINLIYPYEQ
jgi:hypothetical protein